MPVINTTSKNLSTYKTKMFRDVVNLVQNAITDVQRLAMADAIIASQSVDIESSSFINIDKEFTNKGLTGEVGVMGEMEDNRLAAYLEFGTGLSARDILAPYPQWIKDVAYDFWETGRGTLKGKPYLYNNFLVIAEKFKKELKELVDGQSNGD